MIDVKLQRIAFSSLLIQAHVITEDDSELIGASADIIERLVAMFSRDCYDSNNKELLIVQVQQHFHEYFSAPPTVAHGLG